MEPQGIYLEIVKDFASLISFSKKVLNLLSENLSLPQLTLLEKSLIFIPTIYKNIHTHDDSIQKYFDDLCKALAKRFTNLIDYAQPAEFWNKYRTSKIANNRGNKKPIKRKTPKKKKRKTKRDTDDEEADDDEDDEESDNDDDEDFMATKERNKEKKNSEHQLESNEDDEDDEEDDEPLIKKPKRKAVCTEISMDYIFKPNI